MAFMVTASSPDEDVANLGPTVHPEAGAAQDDTLSKAVASRPKGNGNLPFEQRCWPPPEERHERGPLASWP